MKDTATLEQDYAKTVRDITRTSERRHSWLRDGGCHAGTRILDVRLAELFEEKRRVRALLEAQPASWRGGR